MADNPPDGYVAGLLTASIPFHTSTDHKRVFRFPTAFLQALTRGEAQDRKDVKKSAAFMALSG